MAKLGQKRWRHRYNTTIKDNPTSSGKGRARSVKTPAAGVHDVYEFQPSRNRRDGILLSLDDDEMRGAAYNDEDELYDEEVRAGRRPRLIGEGEEDERVRSDEDEEIESDAAFDESDEDRFAGSSFKQKKLAKSGKVKPGKSGRSVQNTSVNLAEDDNGMRKDETDGDESEEEEGEAGDFLDVLDILDGRADPYLEDEENTPEPKNDRLQSSTRESNSFEEDENRNERKDSDEGEHEEEEEEEDDSVDDRSDEESQISASDGENDEIALEALDQFVSGLETGAKRKAPEDEEKKGQGISGQGKKKLRLLKDRTESGIENEFSASAAGSSKLSLDDLLTPLASRQGALASLKKSVKPLADSSNPKNQPLPAPLPTRTQEKLERQAAYEQTKQEVDKWTDTMKRIQEAEHLSFPLQAPGTTKVSNLELTAKFKPTTELESSIDRLLRSAKLHEDEINKTEDLMMKDLTVEEVAARRAELRKMRELAFRADAKAKRIAKIKSKTYRRIHKRERAKLMAKLDGSTGRSEIDEDEERLKAETERARERATLRHKNTGKWARAMKARGEMDVDQRRDINEMLERGERLRRRIQGVGSGEEDESDSNDSDQDEGTEDGIARLRAAAFEELKKVQDEDKEEEETENQQKAKGVFQMKFMKDAAARKDAALDREIDDFRKEMGDLPEGSDSDGGEEEDVDVASPAERVHGRMVFRPGPQSLMHPPPPPSALSALSETSTLRSQDSPVVAFYDESNSTPSPNMSAVAAPATSESPNPWLVEASSSLKVTRRKNELVIGRNVSREQKSEAALQKKAKKGTDEREMERDDAAIEIAADDILLLNNPEKSGSNATVPAVGSNGEGNRKKDKKKKDRKGKGKEKAEEQPEDDESEANSEIEEQETALKKGKKVAAFEQRELVARAFAGDNVIRQFADEKRKEVEAVAPREVDKTLQGWGSWGGAGTKKTAPKPHLTKKVAGIDPKLRADYGKAHVIISEGRDKKAMKFAVKDLPYPYTSKAQFEARMSTPVGVEWNTRVGFQRATLPRVVKKMGTIIDPLEKL